MEDFSAVVLEYVAKVIAPESMIAQAREIKMSEFEKLEASTKAIKLMPGDLILIRTPSSLYEAFRRLGESYYDHIAVVLDGEMSLHISYPRTKIVPTILFTHKKKEPLIIRPKFLQNEREQFLDTLQKISVGKSYDYYRVIQILISSSLFELQKYDDTDTDKIVCSHQIFNALAYSMKGVKSLVYGSDYELNKYGTFTLSDFVRMASSNPNHFDTFPLYSRDELDQKDGKQELSFEGITISIGEDKKMNKFDSILKIVSFTKLKQLIEKYEFLTNLTMKSAQIAAQIYQLRKQIVLLITLYKMIEIIVTAYKEYQALSEYASKDQSQYKKVKEVLLQLVQISLIAYESGDAFNGKIFQRMMKLLLLTYSGTKADFKIKVLKIANFIISLTNRFKERFKL